MDENEKLEELINACGYGLLERVKSVTKEGVNINGCINNMTPLISSIYGQNIEVIEFLIAKGVHINQGTHTALHEAFECLFENMRDYGGSVPDADELQIIRVLINAGVDIEKQNEKGHTPLDAIYRYALNKDTFESFKNIFRILIPDIDKRVTYETK